MFVSVGLTINSLQTATKKNLFCMELGLTQAEYSCWVLLRKEKVMLLIFSLHELTSHVCIPSVPWPVHASKNQFNFSVLVSWGFLAACSEESWRTKRICDLMFLEICTSQPSKGGSPDSWYCTWRETWLNFWVLLQVLCGTSVQYFSSWPVLQNVPICEMLS